MKNYQNQLDRFRSIAKKLVDEHSAALYADEAYSAHLDSLSKQLEEQAAAFVNTTKATADYLSTEIMGLCQQYKQQFIQRNEAAY